MTLDAALEALKTGVLLHKAQYDALRQLADAETRRRREEPRDGLPAEWVVAINYCGLPPIVKVTAQSQQEGKPVTLNFMRDSIIVGEMEYKTHKDVARLIRDCLGTLSEFPDSITLHFK